MCVKKNDFSDWFTPPLTTYNKYPQNSNKPTNATNLRNEKYPYEYKMSDYTQFIESHNESAVAFLDKQFNQALTFFAKTLHLTNGKHANILRQN